MRDGVTRAIRRGAHHGGGFSCWHTRAVGWAVSAAFTFLPKIEGYGGGGRPFSSVFSLRHLLFVFYLPSSPLSSPPPPSLLLFPVFLLSPSTIPPYLPLSLSPHLLLSSLRLRIVLSPSKSSLSPREHPRAPAEHVREHRIHVYPRRTCTCIETNEKQK